jgi:nicotinate phosphoribosyltransferase
MKSGERLASASETTLEVRARATKEIAKLPARLRALEVADPPYQVEVSEALRAQAERTPTG